MYKPFVKANGLNFCGTVRAFAFDDQPGCPVEIVYADYCIQVIVPTHSVNSLLVIGKKQDIANERYTSILNKTCPTQGERRNIGACLTTKPNINKITVNKRYMNPNIHPHFF